MLALFIAQTPAPMSIEWQLNMIALLGTVYLVVNIWNGVRRKPAIDEVFEQKLMALSEATEKRLHTEGQATEKRMHAQSVETDKKIDALDRRREAGEKEVRQLINDQIAQMEKFISKQITDNRESNTDKFSGLFTKMDATQATMQSMSNDVMLHIGRLEGQFTASLSKHE